MKKILGLLTLLLSMQIYAGTTENQVHDETPESVELEKGRHAPLPYSLPHAYARAEWYNCPYWLR